MIRHKNIILLLYPNALSRTYCVPPVYFTKVPYTKHNVPDTDLSALVLDEPPSDDSQPLQTFNLPARGGRHGTAASPSSRSKKRKQVVPYSLWTPESLSGAKSVPVQESEIRDDASQQHVLCNLQELGRACQEVMFVLSQLNFSLDFHKLNIVSAQALAPLDIPPNFQEGEFDLLLIHRDYGILIGEIKSVGKPQSGFSPTQAQADSNVAKKVRQAIRQLDKLETVVQTLVKDLAADLTVRKTLFLPYVSSAQLQRVLEDDDSLQQAVCHSLGAADAEKAAQLCCCSDQLSDPATYWDVTHADLSRLTAWWFRRMTCTVDLQLTDQIYLEVLARFVGPTSTVAIHCTTPPRVEVYTEGQAVCELGRRLARLVLTPQQLDMLNRNLSRVFITGPPGTGKTVLLILQGLRWIRQGHDVHILSVAKRSLAASHLVEYQLQMTVAAHPLATHAPGNVILHQYDFLSNKTDVEEAVRHLSKASHEGTLHVLVDEATFGGSEGLTQLVSDLTIRVPHLSLWATSIFKTDVPPQLETQVLTLPLRSSPVVLREVQQGVARLPVCTDNYEASQLSAPGDGMRVERLYHHGKAHKGQRLLECIQCGKDVAKVLQYLGVGKAGTGLAYRDVFILTGNRELQDEVANDHGHVTQKASGIVRGLHAKKIPLTVLGWSKHMSRDSDGWEKEVADTAVAGTDRVTVADSRAVCGLERRVVVLLSDYVRQGDEEAGLVANRIDIGDRLHTLSRCTTHLVTVTKPSPSDTYRFASPSNADRLFEK